MFAVLLLCLIGIAIAQKPTPCTSPPQWEGRIYDINEQQNFLVRGRFTYDSVYHRERLIEDVEEGSQESFYDTIALFDSRIEFIYDLRARNCSRREINRPWPDFAIPADAHSYGEAYLGSSATPDTGLLVTVWSGNFTTPANDTINYFSTWTYRGCIPVSRNTLSTKYGSGHLSFYDVTLGISDPNVFIPPRECLSETEWAMRYTLFGTPTTTNN